MFRFLRFLVIANTCGIHRPLATETQLRRHLGRAGNATLVQRLEADARSLLAIYEYGRLHGAIRLRWGSLETWISVPWSHRDEPRLPHIKDRALEIGLPLDVVLGKVADWNDPWSRFSRVYVRRGASEWTRELIDESGREIDEGEIQLARISAPRGEHSSR
jgi:hypothetical protein